MRDTVYKTYVSALKCIIQYAHDTCVLCTHKPYQFVYIQLQKLTYMGQT